MIWGTHIFRETTGTGHRRMKSIDHRQCHHQLVDDSCYVLLFVHQLPKLLESLTIINLTNDHYLSLTIINQQSLAISLRIINHSVNRHQPTSTDPDLGLRPFKQHGGGPEFLCCSLEPFEAGQRRRISFHIHVGRTTMGVV